MSISLKYAVAERDRRYLLANLPEGVTCTKETPDRDILRLREVREDDGSVIRKLGHRVRIADGPAEVAWPELLPGQ